MITIQVTGYNGKPVSQSIRADFGEAGGTIGRAPENTLVLLDPERKISRTHASLARDSSGYVLRDQGSVVPVVLNGVPLGNGREAPIAAGDEIRIAGYVMSVMSANAASPEPVVAAREAGSDRGISELPATPVAAKEMAPPIADPAPAAPVVTQVMAEPAAPSPLPVASPASAVVEPIPAPPMATEQTTLANAAPTAAEPTAIESPATESPATEPAAIEPAAETAADMAEPVLSWTGTEAATVDITTIILSPTGQSFTEAESERPDTPEPSITSSPHLAQAADPAIAATADQASTTPRIASPDEDLLRALLAGAGIRDTDIPGGLSPQLMNQLGRLLREATAGLLDLLAARAMTKREVRADMTVIVASDNNPLKFSPDMEAALTHLLVPRGRGFMPPLRAVADAYDDLRAHQLGFMAGMRSALAVVLARFDPHALEERLTETTVVDSLLPTHRKAKLWDLFGELYGTIANDAQNDFHMLFGREFLRAYQAHVAKLPARSESAAHK